jgi:putative transposase
VLLAFIDDHSRLLVGWRWGTGEDVFRLEAALRSGLMSRGVPNAILTHYVPRNIIELLCPN